MAGRPKAPHQGNLAARAALLVLAGWFALPVLAAPNHDILCDSSHDATLEVASRNIDSLAKDHLLKPRVAEAAREVFADDDSETGPDDAVEIETDDTDTGKPRLRSQSNDSMPPFRRQMYRKDI